MFASRRAGTVSLLLASFLAAAGCGKWEKTPAKPTRGEVYAAIRASTDADSDRDGLPDDVEDRYAASLGTDKDVADSDGDGMCDAFEVFGKDWLHVATKGSAGAFEASALALTASDPARSHAEDLVDSDGDGVADYLEFAGYRYEWREAAFVLDPGGFHTDPLQWSTDQDAYGDGMEVSGLNMDVAVRYPGGHPLVPAYPDIVVELRGYSIALNEQITDGNGGELERGQTWSREVENAHSSGSETGFEAGGKFGFGKDGFSFELGGTFKQSWTSTDSHSEKVSSGGSYSERVNWNSARSYSPAEAARLKLFVRVHNRGTAPASNLVPTIGLLIAGANVATFEAAEVPIYMLLPGAAFPADEAVDLVVDRDAAGDLINLTDWELRALQRGAPLTLSVVQKRADVMRLDGGSWVRVGDVNEYLGRIVSVSANVLVDLGALPEGGGQARLARRLVYAGQGPAAPHVSLTEALGWTDGFAGDAASGYSIRYVRDDGTELVVPLAGTEGDDHTWRWQVDPVTHEANWPAGTRPQSVEALLGLELRPGSQVSLRAPRPPAAELPVIHNAYAVPTDRGYEIVACASDYDAVARVVFVDKRGNETEMVRDGRGPWFYTADAPGYVFKTTSDPDTLLREVVRVESVRTTGEGAEAIPIFATQDVDVVYTPTAQPPIVRRFTYDNDHGRFYARIEPGGPLPEDEVDWVRLYHPDLQEAGDSPVAGYRSLAPTIFAFEDPWGWEVSPLGYLKGMRLVAHTRGGRYTSRSVENMTEMSAYREGTVWLRAGNNRNYAFADDEYWTPLVDLDGEVPLNDECGTPGNWYYAPYPYWVENAAWASCVASDPRLEVHHVEWDNFLSTTPSQDIWTWWGTLDARPGLPDLYVRSTGPDSSGFVVGFFTAGTSIGDLEGMTGQAYYDALTYVHALDLSDGLVPGFQGGGTAESYHDFQTGTVLLFTTTEGRLGKAIVKSITDVDEYYDTYSFQRNVKLDYKIYRTEGDGQRPEGMTYATPDALYVVGRAIAPNRPTTAIGDAPDAYRICAGPQWNRCIDGDPVTNDDPTVLPAGLVFDPSTGELSGTPQPGSAIPRTELRVFGGNFAGETWAPLWITVLDALSSIAYPSSLVCETGYACAVSPTVVGTAESWSIQPALPAGLHLSGAGVVGGVATAVVGPATFTVTATNRAGASATATLVVEARLGAPSGLDYPGTGPYSFAVGTSVSLAATVHGGAVSEWSVEPAFPAGLALDPVTGAIHGSPTTATGARDYVVTASNGAGAAPATLNITITASSP